MPLEIGTSLGAYEIQASIGAGGMGEVYRAKDAKLGRQVAIKVLPEALRNDAERLLRFEREARVLASLNHPGIATLHGLESEDDVTYLVMELVPGQTLQERIARGRLDVEEAVGLFQQIAEALEAAHVAGVVHRDLKPANVKITPEGRVKVLDFGLAKAFAADEPEADASRSPTLTRDATAAGVILGTACYMSPEQAKGKSVDERADIWAFGCVLFEALTGRKAFDGESVTEVLANVLHKEVPWEVLPAGTPWRVRDVLRRCLTKDPQERFHHVADARIELADDAAPTVEIRGGGSKGRLFAAGSLGALLGLTLAAFVFEPARSPPAQPVHRFVITPPRDEPPLEIETPVISRDGRRIVYIGVRENDRRLYLRELNALVSRPIEGTAGAHSPFFSPDGRWVGFFVGDKVKKVSLLGGAPIDLCDAVGSGPGGFWMRNDSIWFSGNWNSGFFEVAADGGEPVVVTTPDRERGEVGHWWPSLLPDGKTALFTVYTNRGERRIAALDLETRTWRHLFPGMQAKYVRGGHILFFASGIYQVMPFDPTRLEVLGDAVPALKNTRGIQPTGAVERYFDVSDTGTVVTVPGGAVVPKSVLAWLEKDGTIERLPFAAAAVRSARLDPGGRRVALSRLEGGLDNIWIHDLERGTEERLTQESNNFDPRWAADGRGIVFTTARRGRYDIFRKPLDALGTETPVLARDNDDAVSALSPNGEWLALTDYTIETGEDVVLLRLEDGSDPFPAVQTPFRDDSPDFSRDGRWLAFRSLASGRSEVYVQRVADGVGRVRVSSNGGAQPRFSRAEDVLYYLSRDTVMAVSYRVAGGELRAGTPRPVVELPEGHGADRAFEISPDGSRFLILVETGEDPSPTELHVTANWFQELERLAPTGK